MTKQQIETLAADKGLKAASFRLGRERCYFLRNSKRQLLFEGQSLTGGEVLEFLETLSDQDR